MHLQFLFSKTYHFSSLLMRTLLIVEVVLLAGAILEVDNSLTIIFQKIIFISACHE